MGRNVETVRPEVDARTDTDAERPTTTVEVRCTGHVRDAVGRHAFEFSFEGGTLRAFLEALFERHDLEDLLIAETEREATAHGWAPVEDPPGTWRKNPPGEQTRSYARILVNGRFNEHLGGFDAPLADGDRVSLVYPFMFCC
jgi:molybdopterin converting factor small subunit